MNPLSYPKWRKPPNGWVKCNYDASHHVGDRNSDLDGFYRTTMEFFLNVVWLNFKDVTQQKNLNALNSFIWAMQASWSLGYKTVKFEGDNLNII